MNSLTGWTAPPSRGVTDSREGCDWAQTVRLWEEGGSRCRPSCCAFGSLEDWVFFLECLVCLCPWSVSDAGACESLCARNNWNPLTSRCLRQATNTDCKLWVLFCVASNDACLRPSRVTEQTQADAPLRHNSEKTVRVRRMEPTSPRTGRLRSRRMCLSLVGREGQRGCVNLKLQKQKNPRPCTLMNGACNIVTSAEQGLRPRRSAPAVWEKCDYGASCCVSAIWCQRLLYCTDRCLLTVDLEKATHQPDSRACPVGIQGLVPHERQLRLVPLGEPPPSSLSPETGKLTEAPSQAPALCLRPPTGSSQEVVHTRRQSDAWR